MFNVKVTHVTRGEGVQPLYFFQNAIVIVLHFPAYENAYKNQHFR